MHSGSVHAEGTQDEALNTLMPRRRFLSAVSNHEARGPSFETRAKSALERARLNKIGAVRR
jgi:hypothetical protein